MPQDPKYSPTVSTKNRGVYILKEISRVTTVQPPLQWYRRSPREYSTKGRDTGSLKESRLRKELLMAAASTKVKDRCYNGE